MPTDSQPTRFARRLAVFKNTNYVPPSEQGGMRERFPNRFERDVKMIDGPDGVPVKRYYWKPKEAVYPGKNASVPVTKKQQKRKEQKWK